jgi:hypothetical protein
MTMMLAQNAGRGGPPAFVFFLVGGVIVFVIVSVILANAHEKKRRASTRSTLESRRFLITERGVRDAFALLPIDKLASRPDKIVWSAAGEVGGHPVTLVEHLYHTGGGKNRQTHRHSVVSFTLPTRWPTLAVMHEHFFHKIGEMFGAKDLKLDDERFNKKFRVQGDDEDFAVLLLSPEVQAVMMVWDRAQSLHVKDERLCLVFAAHFGGEDWEKAIEAARHFRDLLPRELDEWTAA